MIPTIAANATLSAAQQAANIDAGGFGLGAGLIVAIAVISALCFLLILGGD